jgi:carbonyl reductase 1
MTETRQRVAVVTGSNKGIGFEIVKKLAAAGLKTIVAARNPELGTAAALAAADFGDVSYRNLDISNAESIQAFA